MKAGRQFPYSHSLSRAPLNLLQTLAHVLAHVKVTPLVSREPPQVGIDENITWKV